MIKVKVGDKVVYNVNEGFDDKVLIVGVVSSEHDGWCRITEIDNSTLSWGKEVIERVISEETYLLYVRMVKIFKVYGKYF